MTDRRIGLHVHYGDRTYHAAIDPAERADQLLLRSLYHFDIDPTEKSRDTGWRLSPKGGERGGLPIELDAPIGQQLGDGAELILEEDTPDTRRPSTGSY